MTYKCTKVWIAVVLQENLGGFDISAVGGNMQRCQVVLHEAKIPTNKIHRVPNKQFFGTQRSNFQLFGIRI